MRDDGSNIADDVAEHFASSLPEGAVLVAYAVIGEYVLPDGGRRIVTTNGDGHGLAALPPWQVLGYLRFVEAYGLDAPGVEADEAPE